MSETWKRPKFFYDVVSAAEDTASAIVISIISGGSSDDWYLISGKVFRADVEIPGFTWTYASATGDLTVSETGSPALTEDDCIRAFGTFV